MTETSGRAGLQLEVIWDNLKSKYEKQDGIIPVFLSMWYQLSVQIISSQRRNQNSQVQLDAEN